MAAPTDVRVESNSLSTATLRWSYSGSNQISVWRSLVSGSGFTEVTGVGTRVATGTTSYTDDTVTEGTRYFYKLSDDVGSTFSSEVNVTIQSCMPPAGSLDTFSLPRVDMGNPDPADEFDDLAWAQQVEEHFNNLAARVEAVLHGRVLVPGDCVACPNNGALVLNCAGHCKQWLVVADEDINSISLQYCDEGPGNIDFIIPPGDTRRIDGWPAGFGFSGDEGFQAPVSGGSDGKTVSVGSNSGGRANSRGSGSRPGTSRGMGSGGVGGGGSGGCACVPTGIGALTIKSCNASNSLNCSQSTKSLKLLACGGTPPYTWSQAGGVTLSKSSGPTTTVTPPANTYPTSDQSTAYWIDCYGCLTCSGSTCTAAGTPVKRAEYDCNDVWTSALPGDPSPCDRLSNCTPAPSAGSLSQCCNNGSNICTDSTCEDLRGGNCESDVIVTCDQRSAQMISDGCNPCGLAADGATVTVTDAVGTQTTVILQP